MFFAKRPLRLKKDISIVILLLQTRQKNNANVLTGSSSVRGPISKTFEIWWILAPERLERMRGRPSSSLPPWPLFIWSCWTKIADLDMFAAENHSHTRLPPSYVDCTRGRATRIGRSSVRGALATTDAVVEIISDLQINLQFSIRLDEVCRLFGSINQSRARHYLHYGVLDCQQYRVRCSSMNEQSGDYHLIWTIYTNTHTHTLSLSLSVKRGYFGLSIVSGSWNWGWNFFFFYIISFVLISLTHWFSKKNPTRNKELTRFTLTLFDKFVAEKGARWSYLLVGRIQTVFLSY